MSTEDGRAVVEDADRQRPRQHPEGGTTAAHPLAQPHRAAVRLPVPGRARRRGAPGRRRDRTKTASVVDLGELFEQLGPIVDRHRPGPGQRASSRRSPQALDGREDKVGQALDDLATLAKGLASRDEAIGRLVDQPRHGGRHPQPTGRADRGDAREPRHPLATPSATTPPPSTPRSPSWRSSAPTSTASSTNNATELDRLLGQPGPGHRHRRGKLPELDTFLAGFAEASAAIFRAGNRGEFLNQKILCAFIGPPAATRRGLPDRRPDHGPVARPRRPFDAAPVPRRRRRSRSLLHEGGAAHEVLPRPQPLRGGHRLDAGHRRSSPAWRSWSACSTCSRTPTRWRAPSPQAVGPRAAATT